MMKKVLCWALLLAMALTVWGCGGGEVPTQTQQTQPTQTTQTALKPLDGYDLYAGYGKANITPEASTPLGGYGSAEKRMSKNVLDDLYVTALALTDSYGKTILLMNWDAVRSYNQVADAARTGISEATGVAYENIYIGASHTHSAPEMTNTHENAALYSVLVIEQSVAAAQEALDDRAPANMSVGSIEVEGLNFVRHYRYANADGSESYFGDNFGTAVFDETTTHTSEADPTMFMLCFERQDAQNIAFVNWRAHPHFTGGSIKYDVSSDWVGAFRDALSYQTGAQVLYYQGASGNINEKSRIASENITTDYREYGALLADYAMELMENDLSPVTVDAITTTQTMLETTVNHEQDDLFYKAKEAQTVYNTNGIWSDIENYTTEYGFRSIYHINAIISNYYRGQTQERELNAILLGDSVCLVTAPNEMFDTNAVWLEENSPVKYTLTLGYTNGHYGYLPSQEAWEYTCYESDISYYVAGTAEQNQQCFLEMINELTDNA